jgi:hypothetical protein
MCKKNDGSKQEKYQNNIVISKHIINGCDLEEEGE